MAVMQDNNQLATKEDLKIFAKEIITELKAHTEEVVAENSSEILRATEEIVAAHSNEILQAIAEVVEPMQATVKKHSRYFAKLKRLTA